MIRLVSRLWRDVGGAAAVEFALVLPFLFFLHLAVVEFVQAYQVYMRVTHVAATLADVTSQSRTVSDTQLADIFMAGDAMMSPHPVAPLGERITSLTRTANGAVVSDWSQSRNFPAAPAPTIPADLLALNESIVVAEAVYRHKLMLSFFLPETIELRHTAYVRPRISAKVERS